MLLFALLSSKVLSYKKAQAKNTSQAYYSLQFRMYISLGIIQRDLSFSSAFSKHAKYVMYKISQFLFKVDKNFKKYNFFLHLQQSLNRIVDY